MTYDLTKPLTPQVDREFASLLCKKLGQHFDSERIERIAVDAREIIDEGLPAWFAFSEAYYTEVALYGDPNSTQGNLVGFLNICGQ